MEAEAIDPAEIDGCQLAAILVDASADTEAEPEVAVVLGRARWDGETLFLERDNGAGFAIPDHRIPELRRVTGSLREVVGVADYAVMLSVGPLPRDAGPQYRPTGLKWPE
jgi:hypothetical protein